MWFKILGNQIRASGAVVNRNHQIEVGTTLADKNIGTVIDSVLESPRIQLR